MSEYEWITLIGGAVIGMVLASIIHMCVDDNRVTNMERTAVELEYATYIDGEFTWKKRIVK